jgi:hypothetical protein
MDMKKQVKLLGMICLSASLLWACETKKEEAQDAPAAAVEASLAKPEAQPTAEAPAPQGPVAVFQFEEELHDFGTIKQGDKVKHVFKFKNVGEVPLTITNIKASCGCTTPSWTKEPIAPNGSGEIEVEFNSAGKVGLQQKSITITANVENGTKVVNIRTNIVADNTSSMNGPLKKQQ